MQRDAVKKPSQVLMTLVSAVPARAGGQGAQRNVVGLGLLGRTC